MRLIVEYPPGWTCEVVVLRLERYVLTSMPLEGALAMAEHLEACEACAQTLALRHAGSSRGDAVRRD